MRLKWRLPSLLLGWAIPPMSLWRRLPQGLISLMRTPPLVHVSLSGLIPRFISDFFFRQWCSYGYSWHFQAGAVGWSESHRRFYCCQREKQDPCPTCGLHLATKGQEQNEISWIQPLLFPINKKEISEHFSLFANIIFSQWVMSDHDPSSVTLACSCSTY